MHSNEHTALCGSRMSSDALSGTGRIKSHYPCLRPVWGIEKRLNRFERVWLRALVVLQYHAYFLLNGRNKRHIISYYICLQS